MKKSFKWVRIVLAALCIAGMGSVMTSCGDDDKGGPKAPGEQTTPGDDDDDDDDNGDNKPGGAKRLKKVSIEYDYSSDFVMEFSYNSAGKVSKVVAKEDGEIEETTSYKYTSQQITASRTSSDGDRSTDVYYLENGLVVEEEWLDDDCEIEYTYSRKKLSGFTDSYGYSKSFEWDGGDLVSTTQHYRYGDDVTCYYDYTNKDDIGKILPFISQSKESFYGEDMDATLLMQGFYGTTPTHLPEYAYTYSGYNYEWSYRFDASGYPTKVTCNFSGDMECVITFVWESVR